MASIRDSLDLRTLSTGFNRLEGLCRELESLISQPKYSKSECQTTLINLRDELHLVEIATEADRIRPLIIQLGITSRELYVLLFNDKDRLLKNAFKNDKRSITELISQVRASISLWETRVIKKDTSRRAFLGKSKQPIVKTKDDTLAVMMDLESITSPLLQPLWEKHSLVARKLSIAVGQLQAASSTEEYQQVGILVRDAWIEFIHKLFSIDFLPEGTQIPNLSETKKMLEHTVAHWPSRPDELIRLSKTLIDLANEVQHKRTIDAYSARWCVLATLLTMVLMLDLDSQYNKLADLRYYKCPWCNSLNLQYTKGQEVDYDGPGPKYEIWSCRECDWEHFMYLQ